MIQAYMTKLEKDMSALDDSISMIEAMLENYLTGGLSHCITSWKFGQLISREKVHRKRTNHCFPFHPFPNYLKFHPFVPLVMREGNVNSFVTASSRRR
jgi:hypothetical protein